MNTKLENDLWQKALDLMPRGTQTMSKCPDQFAGREVDCHKSFGNL